MSRQSALVLVPANTQDLARALTNAMAPFKKVKWDAWTVGGQWSGLLSNGYDPRKNPKNFEHCDLCDGTGTRTKPFPLLPNLPKVIAEARKVPCKCNGCRGTGRHLMDSYRWEHFPGDIQLAHEVDPSVSEKLYSILTLSGEWHDCEHVRPTAHGFIRDKDFPKKVAAILRESDDALAVVIEYHC